MRGEALGRNSSSVWSNRFIASAIIQGAAITLLTASFVGMQFLFSSSVNIIQILSLSFEGPAKWIFLGYILYMILIVAIATTAIFYNHLEVNLQKRIRGVRSALAWTNLVGMNVGGAAVTLMMVYAGLAGSGVLGMIAGGGGANAGLTENPAVMDQFIIPIAAFAVLLIIGVIAGGLAYIATYFQKKPSVSYDDSNNIDMEKIGSV
ncbi:hypothetical protein NTE_00738 [Candidatus Nitrososphaera evergladensis SR1]|uniref:Uncharacterized protein n=1 Tax=Candidatus Nitrososphaera evergladensis SR1 TaxID=1459636 RepID=A0A075MMY3_9ARCH|nr:hypothetical protein [Candidatus Nitrososphaera evergladensis]AIF82816.1 hypothetical protein NTE_00738 [Candidatus Nitrososphaera evergladensis SR1]